MSNDMRSQEHKVRFVEEKPLPPLPPCSETKVDEKEGRGSKRRGSGNGEYAWWTKRWSMSDEEYEKVAREKQVGGRGGLVGKFREEI